ncbi:LysR family transcriptional regulator [Silicimonas sp. MF1-12-2]|uniref:LysR family transcriptional regulator n=1 Tax=Silicimonas sp. MF1-12-2 TaxID=3384793 RepID=UPI0039B6818B
MTAFPARDLEWNDLKLILAICRHESLSGAARELGQTHSTIFRRINSVEEKTGVRFFERFPTGYVMTDAGRTALAYGQRVEAEFNALGLEVLGADGKLTGRVRLTCPEAFAEDLAPGIVRRFRAEHPEIRIDLSPGHAAVDMARREAEVAIRATRTPPEASFGKKIGDFRFALYAASSYLERAGTRTLDAHDWCMIEGTLPWLVPLVWPTAEAGLPQVVFMSRASRAVLNAVAEGMGIALLPCYFADRYEEVERVSDTVAALDLTLWVLTHPDLRGTARVRALMAHLYEELGREAKLYAGNTRSPGGVNLLPRTDRGSGRR